MYCPVCGSESTQGLNYCKRCGTNLGTSTSPIRTADSAGHPSHGRVTGAAWAVALATIAVTLGGLGIVISSAYDLVRPLYAGMTAVSGAATIAGIMVAFGSATVLGTVALLIHLFSKLLIPHQRSEEVIGSRSQFPKVDSRPAQLPSSPSVIGSVTEQTTRNFDPALYRDRES